MLAALRRLIDRSIRSRVEVPDSAFRDLVEQSPDVICRVTDHRFTYVSPSAAAMFGWDVDALIGMDPQELVFEEDRHLITETIKLLASGRVSEACTQARALCRDGTTKWVEATARLEPGHSASFEAVLVMRDISQRKRLEEELTALALQDGLTGLANRRSFDQTLDGEWRRTLREGGEMALLLLDIDHFKLYNDAYGHQAGDDCLRAVAACVSRYARRPGDAACRYGGEELAVILGSTGQEGAFALAEEIRSAIAELSLPHEGSPTSGHVTVSIGVATALARVGGSIRMPESLLQAADHALYKAKTGGRDCIEGSVLIAPSEQG